MAFRKQLPLFVSSCLLLACTQGGSIYQNLLAEHEAREGDNQQHYVLQETEAKKYLASLHR